MHEKKIALFDMDSSLADYESALIRDLNLIAAPNEPTITNLWEAEKAPHMKYRMRMIKNQPNWWLNLDLIPMGVEVFSISRAYGFDCQILTKGPNFLGAAWKEKFEWAKKHLGDVVVTITGGCPDEGRIDQYKSNVYGHFFYDDYTYYMEGWLNARKRGIGIMPVTNQNKDFKHPRVLKYDGNVKQLKQVLERISVRQPNETITLDNLD